MNRYILIFLVVAVMPLTVFSKGFAIRKGGGSGGTIPVRPEAQVHPRSAAMAHATTALKGASETMFDNPANLAMMDRAYDLTLMYSEWIADIVYYQGSVALRPAGGHYGTIGLSFWRKDYGGYDSDDFIDEIYRFYHQSIGLGYALPLIPSLSIGGHVRYIVDHIYPENFPLIDVDDDKIVYDLGLTYRTGLRSLLLGLMCRNYWRNADEKEQAYVIEAGAAVELLDLVPLELRRHSLMLALDRVYTRGLDRKLEIGAEYAFMETIFIRAGYRSPEDLCERNLGAGLRVSLGGVSLQLDYSRGHVDHFGDVNRFAIRIAY